MDFFSFINTSTFTHSSCSCMFSLKQHYSNNGGRKSFIYVIWKSKGFQLCTKALAK